MTDFYSINGIFEAGGGGGGSGVITSFTPQISFGAPGDLSVTYLYNEGYTYTTGDGLMVQTCIAISFTPTFTTASGDFIISDIGVNADTSPASILSCSTAGAITYPPFCVSLLGEPVGGTGTVKLMGSGIGSDGTTYVQASNFTSGQPVILKLSGFYKVEP